ncbi:MAG: fatty acid desaturase [Planctomycetes bacterium]|nr:fatty acid desaturase [Planctomycetota bacterium]
MTNSTLTEAPPPPETAASSPGRRIDWVNTLFLAAAHTLAIAGVLYLVFVRCNPWTLALGALWLLFCGLSITGGYHRYFAHAAYRAHWTVRLFYALFGAASVQNSALRWASDHRRHHRFTDQEEDPYNIRRGFWWAHVGWIFFKAPEWSDFSNVQDLERDPILRFQHRHYVPLALIVGLLVPSLLGLLWGDVPGTILVVAFLRLVIQYHATFAVNSLAHMLGSQPFASNDSARDHYLTALVTFGEGYHNFHHRFPGDYRNGYAPHHYDPTKWWIWALSRVGLTSNLLKTPRETIVKARRAAAA